MSNSKLPERASLEYLKKLAKDRLQEQRRSDPETKLSDVQLAMAREYGFTSWRALKSAVERREAAGVAAFFEACEQGDAGKLRELLAKDPGLVRAQRPGGPYRGWTGLHSAAQRGSLEAVRVLLENGADPNARESGDNSYPLHWAAARGDVDVVRALLDAGGDVHGTGDVHELDAIGWATVYGETGEDRSGLAAFLADRGARHHIFSAIALGDAELIRRVVEDDPKALDRRMSRFEEGQTALHFAMGRKRYDLVGQLIELGADLEAKDQNGRSALMAAMMRADREAIARLHAAGAKVDPKWTAAIGKSDGSTVREKAASLAASVRKAVAMIRVPDIAQTLEWYGSIGFREIGRYGEEGLLNWGMVAIGNAELMFVPGKAAVDVVRLWFYTDEVERLYAVFQAQVLEAAQAVIDRRAAADGSIEMIADLHDPPYGGREFGIRDCNGYALYFRQDRVPSHRKFIEVDPAILDRHAGVYGAGSTQATITNEAGRLMVEPKGQQKMEARAVSETQFAIEEVNALLTFAPGELEVDQGGQKLKLKRVGKRLGS